MKVFEITPSELVKDIEIGQVFVHVNSKKAYILLDRDIVKGYAARWTWFDDLLWNLSKKRMAFQNIVRKVKERGEIEHGSETTNGPERT